MASVEFGMSYMLFVPQDHQLDDSSVSNAIARSAAGGSSPSSLLLPEAFALAALLKHQL